MFALTPYRFNKPMDNLFNDFDSLLEPWSNGHWASGLNISSEEDKYSVTADVPGFTKEDLEISIEDGIVKIVGDKEVGDASRKIHRSFSLPKDIDMEGIQATVENGVLTLTLPKTAQSQKRLISIS